MGKAELVERAKVYLKMLCEGIHPVTGQPIPQDSVFMDSKVKQCFDFISETLDEYLVISERVEQLEKDVEKKQVFLVRKQFFTVTREQCNEIQLSKKPISIMAFTRNINSVIDTDTTEKLTSTRVNKWLMRRGYITTSKVQTMVNKTIYAPTELANKLGIVEDRKIDGESGEVTSKIKLNESAQLFILENIEDIIETT